jgi:hypothetical protein
MQRVLGKAAAAACMGLLHFGMAGGLGGFGVGYSSKGIHKIVREGTSDDTRVTWESPWLSIKLKKSPKKN